jgi:hypothetical protein
VSRQTTSWRNAACTKSLWLNVSNKSRVFTVQTPKIATIMARLSTTGECHDSHLFYVFDRDKCKHNYGFGNINFVRKVVVPVTENPRAFHDVSPLNIINLSGVNRDSYTTSVTIAMLDLWCQATWPKGVSDNLTIDNFTSSDTVTVTNSDTLNSDTFQTSTWTSPISQDIVITETLLLMEEQPDLLQELLKELVIQEKLQKKKKKKKKSHKMISIISSCDKLHHIM